MFRDIIKTTKNKYNNMNKQKLIKFHILIRTKFHS